MGHDPLMIDLAMIDLWMIERAGRALAECPGRGSNPHATEAAGGFKPPAFASYATRASDGSLSQAL